MSENLPGLKEAFRCALERSDKDLRSGGGDAFRGQRSGWTEWCRNHRLVFFAPHEKFVYHSEKITIPAGHGFPYRGSEKVQQRLREEMELAVKAPGFKQLFRECGCVCGRGSGMDDRDGRTDRRHLYSGADLPCIMDLISIKKILQNALGETLDFSPERPGVHCMAKLLMRPGRRKDYGGKP